MQALLDVVLPVFLVIGAGYAAAWRRILTEAHFDNLTTFAQTIAVPCLLFAAVVRLDLSASFDPALLFSFYAGATTGFLAGLLGARLIFDRAWEDSIAIGFIGLFSNSVLLGLAITEQAYGANALDANFAIIALHAPFCYLLGMTAMELVRNRGGRPVQVVSRVASSIVQNAILMAIALAVTLNLLGLFPPMVVMSAVDLIGRAAIPAALFGLGGVLIRYRPEGDMKTVLFITSISLILHPAMTWALGKATGLSTAEFRSAVLTAAMAPGVNTYIFANMYGVAKRVAATSVLLATAISVVTVWVWLAILP